MRARALSILLALTVFAGAAVAAEVAEIELPGPVGRIVASGTGVFAATRDGNWFRLVDCGPQELCATPSVAPSLPPKAPAGALPDGRVAMAGTGDIRRAWYGRPTGRYGHGVLGDAIEGGSLVVEDASGRRFEHVLPDTHVFEDITPRIADLDGDGRNEIVAIRSSRRRGAALAILGQRDGDLRLLDATPEIGRPNRWLNVAGIGDYRGDGRRIVAWVETPHIGGTLKMAAFRGEKLERVGRDMAGFSNHVIGSRELAMSASGDFTGDGIHDVALPSADRRSIVIVSGDERISVALPGRAVAIAAASRKPVILLEDGRLIAVMPLRLRRAETGSGAAGTRFGAYRSLRRPGRHRAGRRCAALALTGSSVRAAPSAP